MSAEEALVAAMRVEPRDLTAGAHEALAKVIVACDTGRLPLAGVLELVAAIRDAER